jgi:hypothetical protein
VTLTEGVALPPEQRTAEGVAAHWDEITDRAGEKTPQSGAEQGAQAFAKLQALGG